MANRKERKVIKGIIHKKCACCQAYKPETEFDIWRVAWDNRQNYCKRCQRTYLRKWRLTKG